MEDSCAIYVVQGYKVALSGRWADRESLRSNWFTGSVCICTVRREILLSQARISYLDLS
jgi:hypothetical protein